MQVEKSSAYVRPQRLSLLALIYRADIKLVRADVS